MISGKYLVKQRLKIVAFASAWTRFKSNIRYLSILTAIFPGRPGSAGTRMSPSWILIGAKDDGGGCDNGSYKTCKAPVKSSSSTNHNLTLYRPDALPVAHVEKNS